MKTSNKLLLIFFGLLVGGAIAVMVYIRFFELKKLDRLIGNNEMVEDPRDVSNFNSLDVRDNVEIVLKNGDQAVVVNGESNLVENVLTETQNNTLTISRKKGIPLKTNQPLIVYIYSPEIQGIKLSQAAKAMCEDTLTGQELKLILSGAAQAEILSVYTNYDVMMSGATSLNLSGQGDRLNATLSDAAEMNAFHLISKDVFIEGEGASSARVHTQNSLNVQLSDACNVLYRGEAQDVKSKLSGASSLEMD